MWIGRIGAEEAHEALIRELVGGIGEVKQVRRTTPAACHRTGPAASLGWARARLAWSWSSARHGNECTELAQIVGHTLRLSLGLSVKVLGQVSQFGPTLYNFRLEFVFVFVQVSERKRTCRGA